MAQKQAAHISAAELASLEETAYLLRSSQNAERLFAALARSQANEGIPQSIAALKAEIGLDRTETK